MKATMAASAKAATVLILSLVALTGCVEIPYLQSTSGGADVDRLDFRASEGNSRVFFIPESDFPFAAYVDGVNIGSVSDRGEYLRAELPAGPHLLQWKDLTGNPDRLQGDSRIILESGQPYLLRVARTSGSLENVGKAGGAELSERTLILADAEATSQIARRSTPSALKGDARTSLTSSPPATRTIKGRLSELKDLYDSGLISKEEYDGKRKQLLDSWN